MKERKKEKEKIKRLARRETEKERERERERGGDCRKRRDTHGDQKRGKIIMSQRTITVASQC